ncbi:MAG: 4-(cytidine 5'-diphospho)-2-C-methyl-D-erythritol kinase [Candidatus Sumerlaeaceae bacterium]|nr:4-(cytidine 5'-diphospho)-2-C-methyl-D-erythritol kinase [Candidatus Sumerlaeaceae bacterium]
MIRLASPAKINWYLRVIGRRTDGFHDIETIFQEIPLSDEMTFALTEEPLCRIAGFEATLPAEQNLIHKAWSLMRAEFGAAIPGLNVEVTKRIPAGGGLGGGSSNAATTLKALNHLCNLGLDTPTLSRLGARLGSDVAFFAHGGVALATGRGEVITPLPIRPQLSIRLDFPGEHVSTAEAYARLGAMKRPAPTATASDVIDALRRSDPQALAHTIHNDFELVVADRPWFVDGCARLKSRGCLRAFLSGSGSTIVGLLPGPPAHDENRDTPSAMIYNLT